MSGSTISSHPSSAVLLDYAADSLDFAHCCVVDTHLPHCSACRDVVSFWHEVKNSTLARVQPVEPEAGLLDRCLTSIARDDASRRGGRRTRTRNGPAARRRKGDPILPPSLRGLRSRRLRWLAPGIWHGTLWRDDRSALHLIRVRAGATLPPHRHRGLELTCVLSGAYRDDGRLYLVGDVSEEDDGDDDPHREQDHVVVAEPSEDCICIVATTGRLRFSGWMARLLQPVMPF